MEQLPLFETGDLQPIQNFLHVWDASRRAALNKNPPILASSVGNRIAAVEGRSDVMRPVAEQARTGQGASRGE